MYPLQEIPPIAIITIACRFPDDAIAVNSLWAERLIRALKGQHVR